MHKLTDDQIIHRLQEIKHRFSYNQGQLIAEFKFISFAEAFGFICKIAIHAAELKHFPIWSQNNQKVKISLYTESVKGLTEKDFEIAKIILIYV
ncbi:hypothetical protein AwWohl_03880 [Gammaproteobacteria bacterium]|nr:hypothetical protein AwWohl_03880 [Gammaproteobacteria bacterium]